MMKRKSRGRSALNFVGSLVVLGVMTVAVVAFINQTTIVEAPVELSDDQRQQFSDDPALQHLVVEGYHPVGLRWDVNAYKPKLLLVHCNGPDGPCDRSPYSRDFPAVLVEIEKVPAPNESIDITEVIVVARRHPVGDKRTTVRSCSKSLVSLPTLAELRGVIGGVVDEDGDIPAGSRITDADGVEQWKCDHNP